jgi:hypothetical protein
MEADVSVQTGGGAFQTMLISSASLKDRAAHYVRRQNIWDS